MKIKVFCRVKPITSNEDFKSKCINIIDDHQLSLNQNKNFNKENESQNSKNSNMFQFQKIFEDYIPQSIVFKDTTQELIDQFIEGFNATLMAYGQTNSGKTFTVLGEYTEQQLLNLKGIAPRSVDYLFEKLQNQNNNYLYSISVQFMEIYNEKILDLLNPKNEIFIREKNKNFETENLTEIFVNSKEEIYQLLKKSESNRTTCYTGMNTNSSRSHFIFQITLIREDKNTFQIQKSLLTIIDLAGSEKIKRTNVQGINKIEAQNINQSLTNLGRVILQLSSQKDQGFVNYRDSVLTKILKNSLGGNALTNLIVTISQSRYNDSETLQTLRFGDRAQNIKNKPSIIQALNPEQMQQKIQQQKEEIKKLKIKIIQLEDQISSQNTPTKSNEEQIKHLIIQMQQEKLMQKIPKFQEQNFFILQNDKDDDDYQELAEYYKMKLEEQVRYQEAILLNFNIKVCQLHDKFNNINLINERLDALKERIKISIKKIKIDAFLDNLKNSSKSSDKEDSQFFTPSKKPTQKVFNSVNFNRKIFQSPNQLPIILEETNHSEIEELLSKASQEEQQKNLQSSNQIFWSNSFSKEFESKIQMTSKLSEQLQQIHMKMTDMQDQLKNLNCQQNLLDKSDDLMESLKQQQNNISELLIKNCKNETKISKNRTILKQFKKFDPNQNQDQIQFLQNQIKVQNKLIEYQEEKIQSKKQHVEDKYEQQIQKIKSECQQKIEKLQQELDDKSKTESQKWKIQLEKLTQEKQNLKNELQTQQKLQKDQLEKIQYKNSLQISDYKKMILNYQQFIQKQEHNHQHLYDKFISKEKFIREYLNNLLTTKQLLYIDQIFDQKNHSFNLNKYMDQQVFDETRNDEDSNLNEEIKQNSMTGSNIKKYFRTPLQNSILNNKFQLNFTKKLIMKKSDVVQQKVFEIKNFFVKMRIIKDNFRNTMIFLIVLVFYFLIIGIFMSYQGINLFEFQHRIDDRCSNNQCEIQFKLHEDIKGPLYLYIGYKDFYVNHRKVMLSVDYEQLDGSVLNRQQASTNCQNYHLNKHGLRFYPDLFKDLPKDEAMHPCGLFSLLYVQCQIKRQYYFTKVQF